VTDVRQQLSPRGVSVLFGYVVVYLAVGSVLYFTIDLPAVVYAAYGVLSWVLGMWLFYRLHRSFVADLSESQE
jgi:hypothetical protein